MCSAAHKLRAAPPQARSWLGRPPQRRLHLRPPSLPSALTPIHSAARAHPPSVTDIRSSQALLLIYPRCALLNEPPTAIARPRREARASLGCLCCPEMPHLSVGCTTHACELAANKARKPTPGHATPTVVDEAPSRVAAMIIPKLSSSALHMRQAWGAALAPAVSTHLAPHSSRGHKRWAVSVPAFAPLYAPQELQTTSKKCKQRPGSV